jgi:hypothetical protein
MIDPMQAIGARAALRINRHEEPPLPGKRANEQPWSALFDKVIVLSLPASTERRRYIERHLPEVGLHDFEFLDATAADDPEVARAYELGEVASYPNCFRCGGLDCGNSDCNNVLIPPQVATFITYLNLWNRIAQGDAERVLVLEDDVVIHDHAVRVLAWLAGEVSGDRIPFATGHAALLRLGWARCEEHEATERVFVTPDVRMSNPCHALTRDFALALVDRYRGIVHTVDEYQHRLAPRPGEAWSVFPPLASELSWSEGVFDSNIHPKAARAQHLRSIGDEAGARRHEQVLRRHVKKKHFRPLLMVGHPRCGTGYAAQVCRQLGLDVGHEKLGADGISSWMFAVEAEDNPYAQDEVARTRRALAWKHLVMPVRDLATAVGSVMRDSMHAPPSYQFRREHILRLSGLDLEQIATPLERAVHSVTTWTRIVLALEPALWFRIEDQHLRLRDFLVDARLCPPECRAVEIDTAPVNANKAYRGVHYPKPEVDDADWQALPAAARAEVAWYCKTFSYADPCGAGSPFVDGPALDRAAC